MEIITEIATALWNVWMEMFDIAKEFSLRAFKLTIWIICGIFILPCVYISGILFPMWTDWGESM